MYRFHVAFIATHAQHTQLQQACMGQDFLANSDVFIKELQFFFPLYYSFFSKAYNYA